MRTPTPGALNVLTSPSSGSADNSGSDATTTASTTDSTNASTDASSAATSYSAHYSFAPAQNDTNTTLSVSVGRNRLATVDEPIQFKAVLNTNDPNTSYFWNFGDGTTGEGKTVTHAYSLAGDYNVVLNTVLFDNEAVSRTRVKVIDPDLSVAEVTPDYVSIENRASYEINLYGWKLVSGSTAFIFPKDTIISAGQTLKLPFSVTKLAPGAHVALVMTSATSSPIVTSDNSPVSTAGTASQSASATSSVSVSAPSRARDIQALADKLVSLNREARGLTSTGAIAHQTPQAAPATSSPVALPAAVIESLPQATSSASWFGTLKTFFGI